MEITLTQIKINSVDVTSFNVNYEYERAFGDLLPEIVLKFVRGVNSAVTLVEGQTLEVWRGFVLPTDEKVFSGFIEKFEPEGGLITITGIDKLWELVRKEVTHVYDSSVDPFAGKISEIFKDLVTTFGGLNADATTVQDSGTTLILQKFVCNHTDPFERCKKLAEVLDWQFYYRADTDKVYFEPRGFLPTSTVLTVGTNVMQIPKWQYDATEMTNDVTVVGAFQEVETTKSGQIGVTSGFTTTFIQLDYEPISVKVFADAFNPPTTLKTGGVPDSTSAFDYFVDKPRHRLLPKSGTFFTTNFYFEVRYSLAAPIPVNMYSQSSIDTHGRFKKTITLNDIRSVADAENRGTNYLIKYAAPFVYTTLKVKNASTFNLKVGQTIQVVDNVSIPAVNRMLVINKHRIRYPADYDEIDVGDRYWRLADFQATVMEKFKRIAEDEFANSDIVNNLVTIDNTTDSPVVVANRYVKVQTQTASGTNIFILGNSLFGTLGTNRLGSAGLGAEVNASIIQFNNIYAETFYDNDFKDASATTATWNNSLRELTFTAGQTGQSTSVDFNNTTITTATLTATIFSGSFNFFLSADGGANYEAVTNGIAHAFTFTGTDLRWKITESAASTGKITQIQITAYH